MILSAAPDGSDDAGWIHETHAARDSVAIESDSSAETPREWKEHRRKHRRDWQMAMNMMAVEGRPNANDEHVVDNAATNKQRYDKHYFPTTFRPDKSWVTQI